MNKLIILVLLIPMSKVSFTQHINFVNLKLTMPTMKVYSYTQLNLKIKIYTDNPIIKIPLRHCINYRYNSLRDPINDPDIIVELQMLSKNIYLGAIVSPEKKLHNGICYDSTGNELFDTLSISRPLNFITNISPFYSLQKGKYRVRIKLIIKNSTNKFKEFLYSNWQYFEIIKSKIDYSDFGK